MEYVNFWKKNYREQSGDGSESAHWVSFIRIHEIFLYGLGKEGHGMN